MDTEEKRKIELAKKIRGEENFNAIVEKRVKCSQGRVDRDAAARELAWSTLHDVQEPILERLHHGYIPTDDELLKQAILVEINAALIDYFLSKKSKACTKKWRENILRGKRVSEYRDQVRRHIKALENLIEGRLALFEDEALKHLESVSGIISANLEIGNESTSKKNLLNNRIREIFKKYDVPIKHADVQDIVGALSTIRSHEVKDDTGLSTIRLI